MTADSPTSKPQKALTAAAPGAVDPGYTTTEFYQTLFLHLIAASVAIGAMIGVHFKPDGVQAIVPSAAVAAAAIGQIFYNRSRATVKAAAQTASAQAASARATAGVVAPVRPATAQNGTSGHGQASAAATPDASDREIRISFGAGLGVVTVESR